MAETADMAAKGEQWVKALGDPGRPSDERVEAMICLEGAFFGDLAMGGHRAGFMAGLRNASETGDLPLRIRAFSVLCAHKDRDAQKRLLESLEDPDKELIPAHEALAFLHYDIHVGVFPAARRWAEETKDPEAQEAALNILEHDPHCADVLARVLQDRRSAGDCRYLAGSLLTDLDGARFVEVAKRMWLDLKQSAAFREYALENAASLETSPEDLDLRAAAERLLDLEPQDRTSTMVDHARAIIDKTPGPEEDE